MSNFDVIGIGTDLVINRSQFRFAYIRHEIYDEGVTAKTYSTLLVFDGGPEGELVVPHPDASSIESLDKARAVLDEFHQALTFFA